MSARHTPGPLRVIDRGPRQVGIESDWDQEGDWDDIYVNLSGFVGSYSPQMFAEAPAMLEALRGVMDILGRAESNASGNPEWDYVGPRVAAVRAILARIDGDGQ